VIIFPVAKKSKVYATAWQAETKLSDRFDLPKNMAFTFVIRMFWQFHAVTALRFLPACHNNFLRSICVYENKIAAKSVSCSDQNSFVDWFGFVPCLSSAYHSVLFSVFSRTANRTG
jgi:hypothetical protein